MSINTEVWMRDIAEELFPSNSFMMNSISDDAFVENSMVHLPQAGAAPEIEKNRTTIPAVASTRVDTIISYPLAEFTSTPTVIRDIERVEVSYDKRGSVLRDHNEHLNLSCANDLQYTWAGSNVIRTTGASRPANTPGAVGNRKSMTIKDFIAAKQILDDWEIPADQRVVLLPSHFYNDLIDNFGTELLRLETTGKARYGDGELNKLMGFTIYQRGKFNVLRCNNDADPLKISATVAGAGDDNATALFWHPNFVRRAKGTIDVFTDEKNPLYYGSIFSALARVGGSKRYDNGRGIVTLVEAAV